MLEAETPRHAQHPGIAWGSVAIPVERDEPPAAVAAAFLDPRQCRGGAAGDTERLHANTACRACVSTSILFRRIPTLPATYRGNLSPAQPAYDAPEGNNRPERQDHACVGDAGRTEGPAPFPPSAPRGGSAAGGTGRAPKPALSRPRVASRGLPAPRWATVPRCPGAGYRPKVESRSTAAPLSTASPQRRPRPTGGFHLAAGCTNLLFRLKTVLIARVKTLPKLREVR
jgi:hypothetical protein